MHIFNRSIKGFTWLLLLIFSFNASFLYAQDASKGSADSPELEHLALNQSSIDLSDLKNDQELQTNLKKLLNTMHWFDKVEISVHQGIVFLKGQVESKEHKLFLDELLKKFADIVAVVNDVDVPRGDLLNFQPALKEINSWSTEFSRNLPYYVSALLLLVLFLILTFTVYSSAQKILSRKYSSPLFVSAVSKLITAPILLLGLYLVVKVSGLNGLAATLLGGTGLVGLILGLSLKSTAENYISSLMISLKKTFRKGDIVQIGEHKGVVLSVSTTGTTLVDFDGNHIVIPNAKIFTDVLQNFTVNPKIRDAFTVGIGYDDDINVAKQIILDAAKTLDAYVLEDPPVQVLVEGLGASTVNLGIYFWINGHKNSIFKVKSVLIQKVKEDLMSNHISMPDDAREVIFPKPISINMLKTPQNKLIEEPQNETKPIVQPSTGQTHENLGSDVKEIEKQAQENPLPSQEKSLI